MIDLKKFAAKTKAVGASMGADFDLSRPTLRNAVLVSLLERRGRPCGYRELLRAVTNLCVDENRRSSKSKSEAVTLASLRVAVSDVSGNLEARKQLFRIKAERFGKETRLSLVRYGGRFQVIRDKTRIIQGVLPLALQPEEVSRSLLRDGATLSPACLYTAYRSAAQWLSYSSGLGHGKRDYEAAAYEGYGIDKLFGKSETVSVLGLAPGEGLGEIELLRKLLDSGSHSSVHYMCIDSSELLLTSHTSILRERFASEIESGKLVVAPVHGDLFCLESQMSHAREKLGSKFLAEGPILVTYLGNCLGNQEFEEIGFVQRVLESFAAERLLVLLVGVSLLRWKPGAPNREPIADVYYMDAFTLETPRSLLYDQKLLLSVDSDGNPIPDHANTEFLIPFHEGNVQGELVPPEVYSTPVGVSGLVYRFRYLLKNDLCTTDGSQKARKGTPLVLSSIIKFDFPTLVLALRNRGMTVWAPPEKYKVWQLSNGPEQYEYGVFAIVREAQ